MAYIRPQNLRKLDKAEKVDLYREYVNHYEKAVQEHGLKALNTKIPRETFATVLDKLGEFLLNHTNQLLEENRDIQTFLRANPLPLRMAELLPDDFRVFSLLLNSLKQWVSAESDATDRFLLGGTAKKMCREAVNKCIITGKELGDDVQLHHPVRDGRPPIPLSKKGHDLVELVLSDSRVPGLIASDESLTEKQNEQWPKLKSLRAKRNQSWRQLREGCSTLLNPSEHCRPGAKSFANVTIKETGMTPEEIIQLLDCVGK